MLSWFFVAASAALVLCSKSGMVLACQNSCRSKGFDFGTCHGTAMFCEGKNIGHNSWWREAATPDMISACERYHGDDWAAWPEFDPETRKLISLLNDVGGNSLDQIYFCDWEGFYHEGAAAPFETNGNCGSGCWTGNKRCTCYNQRACSVTACEEAGRGDASLAGQRLVGAQISNGRPPRQASGATYSWENARILDSLAGWKGVTAYTQQDFCFCLYEPTWESFNGQWEQLAIVDHEASFERSLSVGTSLTSTESITESHSESIAVAIGAKYSFIPDVFEGSVTVTGTLSQTTANMISSSFSETTTEGCTVSYPSPSSLGYNFLQVYRWTMNGFMTHNTLASVTQSCSTLGIYTDNQAPVVPRCPLGDCADIQCQECISGVDYFASNKAASSQLAATVQQRLLRGTDKKSQKEITAVAAKASSSQSSPMMAPKFEDMSAISEEEAVAMIQAHFLRTSTPKTAEQARDMIEEVRAGGKKKARSKQTADLENFKNILHKQYPQL